MENKLSKNSHTPKESKLALLGGRNPLIASTLLLTSICLHLRKPNYWAPGSCGEERKCFPSAWIAAAGKDGRSINKAKLQIK